MKASLIIGICFLFSQQAFACAACFGASDAPMAKGMNMAILSLLGITLTVLSGFLAFIFHIRRRSAGLQAS